MLKAYFEDLFNTTKAGEVREESYYPDLKKLFETWAQSQGKNYFVTALPRKTEAGNPDFRILTAQKRLVGYIEAKVPTVENLDSIEKSEQLKRYRETFPNLMLTNFFEFRLYRHGELVDKVAAGRPFVIHTLKMAPPVENEDKFLALMGKFFAFSMPRTTTAKMLAMELAKRTRFLRDNVIAEELKEGAMTGTQTLEAFYHAFKDHLIASLRPDDFANLFAQTITYGLFAARSRADNGFNRELAYKYIPHTVGILRDVFRFISSTDLPHGLEWIVDEIAEVLANADVKKIMADFYQQGKGHDPIIHFYETFLTEYDPKERGKRGVYYTPEPVVSYIVRSIHQLLKEKFGKIDGFADPSVTVLDPAAGTLTFPAAAIHQAVAEYQSKYGEGGVHNLIKEHILKNFYAFELMMAPYAVGHLKIGFILDELGYRLGDEERFNLYLTNTLDFTKEDPDRLPGIIERTLAQEANAALEVKEKIPIMVVMGNPPYSVSSSNIIKAGSSFHALYESYKEMVRKEEKNIQPLSDDYIKFMAFAHSKVKQAGQGIVGMITNNSYLDGLIHRDMRKKLLDDFDEIYILNLHGRSDKNQESKPSTIEKDKNIFDIKKGVGIVLMIKNPGHGKSPKYFDLWGTREEKSDYLNSNDVTTSKWKAITPIEPFFFLTIKDFRGLERYDYFVPFYKIFNKFTAGVVTGKDDVLTDQTSAILKNRIVSIIGSAQDDNIIKLAYKLDNSAGDKILLKRSKVTFDEKKVKKYHYRPLDYRFVYYEKEFLERSRWYVADHMSGNNLAISVSRLTANQSFSNVIVSDCLVDYKLAESTRGSYFFPLYLYPNDEKKKEIENGNGQRQKVTFMMLMDKPEEDYQTRKSNLNPAVVKNLVTAFGKQMEPEEIFNYIYAVLYANTYREKYQEFLKIDFPRIPFTKDYSLFKQLAELGQQLVRLHLLQAEDLNNPTIKFNGAGEGKVEKRRYQSEEGRVYINDQQYFEQVTPELWGYYVGGYQVLDKWLKDRVGRTLSSEEIKHYCRVATSLARTMEIQKEIDGLYPEVEKSFLHLEYVDN